MIPCAMRVGSKNEQPGRTGFAHLFEHLMFNGSEHYNDDYFQAIEPLGATDLVITSYSIHYTKLYESSRTRAASSNQRAAAAALHADAVKERVAPAVERLGVRSLLHAG